MSKKNRSNQAQDVPQDGSDSIEVQNGAGDKHEVPVSSQNEQSQQRIHELEMQLKEAQSSQGSSAQLLERIAHLEGKLQGEMSNEDKYQARLEKYKKNVAAKQAKRDKQDAFMKSLENEE